MDEEEAGFPQPETPYWADLEIAEAALDGDEEAAAKIVKLLEDPRFRDKLRSRGATDTEAGDLVGDLIGDCFGGEKKKGGLHRLLGHFNGRCPLMGYLQRVALHRLINLKRKKSKEGNLPGQNEEAGDAFDALPGSARQDATEDAVVDLLRSAVVQALAQVDKEKLVMLRLVHSYRVAQKRVASMWELTESTFSRAMAGLRDDLQHHILQNVRRLDPWLDIDWEDFLDLCAGSLDLFAEVESSATSPD